MNLSDQEYIERCRNGNPDDFRFLVERYQGPVFAFVAGRLNDRTLAREIAEEAFVRAFFALDVEVFLGVASNERLRNHLGGLLLLQLGETFTSAATPAPFVPYEIQLRDGTARKHSLALKKHPRAGRWMIAGGI